MFKLNITNSAQKSNLITDLNPCNVITRVTERFLLVWIILIAIYEGTPRPPLPFRSPKMREIIKHRFKHIYAKRLFVRAQI